MPKENYNTYKDETRRYYWGKCKYCQKEYFNKWKSENPQYQKEYRSSIPKEKNKEYGRRYYLKHKDKVDFYNKEYVEKNKEKWREYSKKKQKEYLDNLHDAYCKGRLIFNGFDKKIVNNNPELVDTYRQLIKIKRLCKSKTSNN